MDRIAEELRRYLQDCFARGDVARTSELAQQLGMSTVQFTRVCRRELAKAPCRYFRELQIERARELLLTTRWTLDRISIHAGFGTLSTFFRVFHQYERCTPADFRAMQRSTEKNTTTQHSPMDLRS